MPAQNTPRAAWRSTDRSRRRAVETDLLTLGCGQIAVALHVAGLPARWRRLSTDSLIDLALKGIAMIGLNEVLRIDAESRHIRSALYKSKKTPHAEAVHALNQLQRIWSSDRSRQTATDAAWSIFHPSTENLPTRNTGRALDHQLTRSVLDRTERPRLDGAISLDQ